MIIKDANIFTQDNRFVKGSVVVENGRFVSIAEQPEHAGNRGVSGCFFVWAVKKHPETGSKTV